MVEVVVVMVVVVEEGALMCGGRGGVTVELKDT